NARAPKNRVRLASVPSSSAHEYLVSHFCMYELIPGYRRSVETAAQFPLVPIDRVFPAAPLSRPAIRLEFRAKNSAGTTTARFVPGTTNPARKDRAQFADEWMQAICNDASFASQESDVLPAKYSAARSRNVFRKVYPARGCRRHFASIVLCLH